MLNKKFIQSIKRDYVNKVGERRQIISLSNIILHNSKRAIFSLHKMDFRNAEDLLNDAEKALVGLEKKFGHNRLSEEGAYKAGTEEYVEAKMFHRVLTGKKVDKINKITLDTDSLLGGICDLTGEMVRKAINEASKGNYGEVGKIKEAINEIMAELVEFDMTGYLRTKYDQARTNLRKIEQINYEINLRK